LGDAAPPRAVILAGGKGTRLAPFTVNFPKPLMPLGDTPVIEVLIRHLLSNGITDVTVTLGHLAELVKAYFSHRHELTRQIDLRFVVEEEPTGTAGSLRLVEGLDSTFLVMNGDLLTDLDFKELLDFHRKQNAVVTIATHPRQVKMDYGVLELDGTRVQGYLEKPETTHHVSMGIYVYEPAALQYIPAGRYFDFPSLIWALLDNRQRVCAFVTDCMWLDIGRPDDYGRAQQLFAEKREAVDRV
jgi:NDP-mannose synthase